MSRIDQYEYCAEIAAAYTPAGGVVLDYGCGSGEIVAKLLARGIDAYGCDLFYAGGAPSRHRKAMQLETRVEKIEGGRIPFEDATFDTVITNQVMEHVDDLDAVVAEIHRVLKPDGYLISMFPDASVWREGHTGVPFLHWLAPGQFRLNYTAACLALGLGYRHGKSIMEAAKHHVAYLDRWTRYRSYNDIRSTYGRYLSGWRHIEEDWFSRRLGQDHPVVRLLPDSAKRHLARKFAGMAFIVQKKPT